MCFLSTFYQVKISNPCFSLTTINTKIKNSQANESYIHMFNIYWNEIKKINNLNIIIIISNFKWKLNLNKFWEIDESAKSYAI